VSHARLTGSKGGVDVYNVSIYACPHKVETLSHPSCQRLFHFESHALPCILPMLETPLQRNLEDGKVRYIEA
jgi:hypothetical protein